MKTRTVDTVASNEEDVRLRIYDGDLQISDAANELIRMERAQHDATRSELRQVRAKLRALALELARTEKPPEFPPGA